jgi:hypothetical protein
MEEEPWWLQGENSRASDFEGTLCGVDCFNSGQQGFDELLKHSGIKWDVSDSAQ